jgi:hypothetical protein
MLLYNRLRMLQEKLQSGKVRDVDGLLKVLNTLIEFLMEQELYGKR